LPATAWPSSAPHRRQILSVSFATTGDQFELTGTDLIVRGSLATYRIDLATANVRLDIPGTWLSFDSRPAPDGARPHQIPGVPALDDDEILNRTAILADDSQLASRKLLKQIRGS
jgi:hypothetical protein